MKPTNIKKTERPNIVLASLGVFSTGINVKRIFNIVITSPTKSSITLLQSIGRGLRKLNDKKLIIIDIADDLSHKSFKNITLKHFYHRLGVYKEQKFLYNVFNIDL